MTRKKPTKRTKSSPGPADRPAPAPEAIPSSSRADTDVGAATAETISIHSANSRPTRTTSEVAVRREPIAANRTTIPRMRRRTSSLRRGRTGFPAPARRKRAPACTTGPPTRARNPRTTRKKNAQKPPAETLVLDEITETLPKTRVECPKCGHYEAYWVMRQTRAADEPTTRIYRCVKCQHTWREY